MDGILRRGATGIALAFLVACGKDEPAGEPGTPARPPPGDAPPAVRTTEDPSPGDPSPGDVTRLVLQKKLDGQLEERDKLLRAIAGLEARKEGITGGKYASDLDAQIEGLRAEIADLDRKILLTRATLQQLPE